VGTANNGKIALTRIASLKPDLITLDVEMPVMDGLETLQEIQKSHPDVGVIMLSSWTKRGSDITMKALELGAFDFIPKPDAEAMQANVQALRGELQQRIKVFSKRLETEDASEAGDAAVWCSGPRGLAPSTGPGGALQTDGQVQGGGHRHLNGRPQRIDQDAAAAPEARGSHLHRPAHAAGLHQISGREPGRQVPVRSP
jgi:chemotaxis response regulator CheB